jgi:hypothetical protein
VLDGPASTEAGFTRAAASSRSSVFIDEDTVERGSFRDP